MNRPSRAAIWLWKRAIASVWLYQGLWHKIFSSDDRHRRIMAEALGGQVGPIACIALGLFEAALGIAVLASFRPLLTAWTQILLLTGMNIAGLIFAASSIPDPVGMVTMNLVFAVSIWILATLETPRMEHEE